MFSSNSGNKSKRKSFFFFGNDGKSTTTSPSPSKTSTHHSSPHTSKPNSSKNTTNKTISSKRTSSTIKNTKSLSKGPLDVKPLQNNNPFIEQEETHHHNTKIQTGLLTPSNGQLNLNKVPTVASIPDNIPSNPFNPFTSGNANTSTVSHSTMSRRPPPPPLNVDLIKQNIRDKSPSGDVPSSIHDRPESSENVLCKPMENVNPETVTNPYQHRRQRSEAEKLVDDIDHYIIEHKELSTTPGVVEIQSTPSYKLTDIDPESGLELNSFIDSSSGEIKPEVSLHIANAGAKDGSSLDQNDHYADAVSSDMNKGAYKDKDSFSFTNSLSSNSVRSVQHVEHEPTESESPHQRYNEVDDNDSHMSLFEDNTSQRTGDQVLRVTNAATSSIASSNRDSSTMRSPNINYSHFDSSSDEHTNSQAEIMVPEEPPRRFRIANEEKPTFFVNEDDSTTLDFESDKALDTVPSPTSSYSERIISNSRVNILENTLQLPNDTQSSITASTTSITKSLHNPPKVKDGSIQADMYGSPPTKLGMNSPISNADTTAVYSTPSKKSSKSTSAATSVLSPKSERNVRLVSSYVEELRLKYYKTSNFLQAPPNLPSSLKQKNNLIQPKNIKVRIRTSSKQIGIKHGRVKQKLLTLETTNEEEGENQKDKINVDHTKEFHKLLNRESSRIRRGDSEMDDASEDYLNDIPGDEASL